MATLTNASGRALECDFLYFRDRHRSVMTVGEVVTLPVDFSSVVGNRYKPRLRRAYAAAVAGGLVTYAESMQAAPPVEAALPVEAVVAPVEVEEEPVVEAAVAVEEPVVEELAVEEELDAPEQSDEVYESDD